MPGRYSHSVVLAGYSSQGIITLPNDQRLEYFKHSPYSGSTQPRTKADGRTALSDPHLRSQSAMNVRSGRWTPVSLDRKPSTRRIYIDTDDNLVTTRSKSPQPPRPASTTPALQRRSLIDRNLDRNSVSTTIPSSILRPANDNHPRSPVRTDEKRTEMGSEALRRSKASRQSLPSDANLEPHVRSSISRGKAASQDPLHEDRYDRPAAVTASGYVHQTQRDVTTHGGLRHHRLSAAAHSHVQQPHRDESEPNFDDFSDAEDPRTSYFAPRSSTPTTSYLLRDDTVSSENMAGTSSPVSIIARSRQSFNNYTPSSSMKSERNDTANSDDSTRNLNSKSSISSLGSSVGQASTRVSKPVDVKRPYAPAPTAAWGLPEIEEDAVFDPEIFAQDLGDDLDAPGSPSEFGHSAFGMISSGRDVNFYADNDDDAVSEGASACPPDISRYRDEDDVTPAPAPELASAPLKMRLTSISGTAPFPTTFPTKPKKGFLARLTAKRSWA